MLAIEAVAMADGDCDVQITRHSERLTVARHNDIAWIYCAQAGGGSQEAAAYHGATGALQHIEWLLSNAAAGFDRVIRTWFYQGSIVAEEGTTQRYKELNRARDDFYRDISFFAGLDCRGDHRTAYPASTGIGTQGRGLTASAVALTTERSDVLAVPMENPRQAAACDYPDAYGPRAPRFSRAVALVCGSQAMLLVSGTASITGSKTCHQGSAVDQTQETLDNIEALIGEENLRSHALPGFGTSLDDLVSVRVYIKREEDYPKVHAVCQRRLGDLPAVYVVADVCRPELLVEIEGVAVSSKPPARSHLMPDTRPIVLGGSSSHTTADLPISQGAL
jgi:enamine deaminase RidA (YjgF/YER057c/UK114 family)